MTGFKMTKWVIRGAFAAAFIGMGINHFRPKPAHIMSKMIPPRLRWEGALSPKRLVLYTGICEVAGGIGLLIPGVNVVAAIALMAFLVAVFPANAYAAANPKGFGAAAIPFWPRLGAQIAMIALLGFTLTA